MGKNYTEDAKEKISDMTMRGYTVYEISEKLGHPPASIVNFCYKHKLQIPSRAQNISARHSDSTLNKNAFKNNAIAGLRHCKDLAANHPYGCGELNIPPDGKPMVYYSLANTRSLVGSHAAMCAE